MSNRVIHFEIQADDIDRAMSFYEKTFGWDIEKSSDTDGMMDYWIVKTGESGNPGINGGMYKRPDDNMVHTYDCTVMVDDIDKAIEDVKKNGGKITRDKMKMEKIGWFARAVDTEGNTFGLMQATEWQPD